VGVLDLRIFDAIPQFGDFRNTSFKNQKLPQPTPTFLKILENHFCHQNNYFPRLDGVFWKIFLIGFLLSEYRAK
jgi:hypothetical protein